MSPSPLLAMVLLVASGSACANFFLDSETMKGLMTDYEAYQERREIRYMAKASQFVGYVTGVVDAFDGDKFCIPGGIDAEQAAGFVAAYVNRHEKTLPRRASETVAAALAERYPCRR